MLWTRCFCHACRLTIMARLNVCQVSCNALIFYTITIIVLGMYVVIVQFYETDMDYFTAIVPTVIMNHSASQSTIRKRMRNGCSCLNHVFSEIFVISIESRYGTLSLTLYQLEEESINYTVWEGHSATNPYSIQVWHQFRHNLDAKNASRFFLGGYESSLYYNKNKFFLRQTQIDILKYSLRKGLQSILILEDDVLLANPFWMNMFCDVIPSIRKWIVINIGVNQGQPDDRIQDFMAFKNHSHLPMKFYSKNVRSWGTFGIAIHSDWFEEFIDLFDIESERINAFPFDEYFYFYQNRARVRWRAFNIHPTLVLPDVTSSSVRVAKEEMLHFIQDRTTDHNASHFSKYWHLRFSNNTQSYIHKITATMPPFHQLVRHSPSNYFLKKH
eukprot:802247_1